MDWYIAAGFSGRNTSELETKQDFSVGINKATATTLTGHTTFKGRIKFRIYDNDFNA